MTELKACHNCRKRRLRCDRSIPACYKCSKTGQKCLGYGRVYRWVGSADPPEKQQWGQGQNRNQNHCQSVALTASSKFGNRSQNGGVLSTFPFLADPLLQDLRPSSRHYLSYFASRFCQDLVVHDSAERGTNPFRELIPMSQMYPYLQHIIIAVSAVHYYYAIKHGNGTGGCDDLGPAAAQNALVDALRARQEAIQALIGIIQTQGQQCSTRQSQTDQDALLATVLFFVNFTLIDSGRDGWKHHLTAAGRLLSIRAPAGDDDRSTELNLASSSPCRLDPVDATKTLPPQGSLLFPDNDQLHQQQPLAACDYVASDTVAYFIWNCALESLVPSRPTSSPSYVHGRKDEDENEDDDGDNDDYYAAQPLTWDVQRVLQILSRTEANSYHSCPAHLLGIVLRVARLAQAKPNKSSSSLPQSFCNKAQMDAYIALLREAETFDVEAWAQGVSTHVRGMLGVDVNVGVDVGVGVDEDELRLRTHIAATYRAAVCLYILLVAPGLSAEVRRRRELLYNTHNTHPTTTTTTSPISTPHIYPATTTTATELETLPTLPTTRDLATTIAQCLSYIPKTSPLFKYTVWPVFLTGVDAASPARRQWVLNRLRAMRDLCPWGMMTSAMETLAEIWRLRDGAGAGAGVGEYYVRDASGLHVGTSQGVVVEGIDEDDGGGDWLTRLHGLRIDCLIV
ncbi:hypothetical protein F4777DRAFT_382265 [Nemania sp. FL0916]|nr:hypothetical protein F4777DRAFT_382265 [Nemania sp. FL0916]